MVFHASAPALDIAVGGDLLHVATERGSIETFSIASGSKIGELKFDEIEGFIASAKRPPRVYSVDLLGARMLILAEAARGGRALFLKRGSGPMEKVIGAESKLAMVEVRFLDASHAIAGLLSNEAALIDLERGAIVYRRQISMSPFADFALDAGRTRMAWGDESGVVRALEPRSGEAILQIKDAHKDAIYKVAIENGIIASGSRDRRVMAWSVATGAKLFERRLEFPPYLVALDPPGRRIAFQVNERSEIALLEIAGGAQVALLAGSNSAAPVSLVFVDESTIILASSSPQVELWRLK